MFLLGDLIGISLLMRLLVASLLWVLLHLLIRFHSHGIEIAGAILFCLGFIWWLSVPGLIPPYGPGLLLIGFCIYCLGRGLRRLRLKAIT
jgi:hypothetical protein